MLIITTIILVGFILLFVFMEGRRLIEQRDLKGLVLASIILLISTLYGIDMALNKNFLPNPSFMLDKLKPLAQLIAPFSSLN